MYLTRKFDNSAVRSKQSQLFSVDVKDIVNTTELRLPVSGKLILANLHNDLTSNYVVRIESDKLHLCRAMELNAHDNGFCWKLASIEYTNI